MAVNVSLDVYPARVELPSGETINKSRLIIADGRVLVYITQNGTPRAYFERDVLSTDGRIPTSGITINVSDGEVRVRKAGGCGCGSRLKNFNPFPGQVRAKVPL